MKYNSVLIAIPCYGGQIQDTTSHALYKFAKHCPEEIRHELLLISNESLISTGRSNIANMFVNDTDFDYLMCIDSDIGFEYRHIIQLMHHQQKFVTGAYSMKTLPPDYNFQVHPNMEVTGNNLIRVSHIGTGFQLVHRSVFTDIALHFPELKYNPETKHRKISEKNKNNSYHYYQTIIDSNIVPEDISFCRRYNEIGGKIWLDASIKLTHAGNHIFNGVDDLEKKLIEGMKNR